MIDTKKLFSLPPQNISGSNSERARADMDYYATPFWATEEILRRVDLSGHVILEPAAGEGHIVKVLKDMCNGCTVIANDISYRKSRLNIDVNGGVDFLQYEPDIHIDTIITNPPYSMAKQFIEKSISIAHKYVIMLCKIQLLEGVDRRKLFDRYNPKYIYVFSNRVSTLRNGDEFDQGGHKWATTMCLAWFVWEIGYCGDTVVKWI